MRRRIGWVVALFLAFGCESDGGRTGAPAGESFFAYGPARVTQFDSCDGGEPIGTTEFTYDAAGRLVRQARSVTRVTGQDGETGEDGETAVESLTLTWTWGADGRLTAWAEDMGDGVGGSTHTITYGTDGLVAAIDVVETIVWRASEGDSGSDTETYRLRFEYQDGRVALIRRETDEAVRDEQVVTWEGGRPARVEDLRHEFTRTFTYDAAGRLLRTSWTRDSWTRDSPGWTTWLNSYAADGGLAQTCIAERPANVLVAAPAVCKEDDGAVTTYERSGGGSDGADPPERLVVRYEENDRCTRDEVTFTADGTSAAFEAQPLPLWANVGPLYGRGELLPHPTIGLSP